MTACLQEHYAPRNACFGCGPANRDGLHLRSFVDGSRVIATWQPAQRHEAFPNVLNGGIIGTLLDCHSNWTAAWALMREREASTPPCTVTMDYQIALRRPTPTDQPVQLIATVTQIDGDRVTIAAELRSDNALCATCTGRFLAVKPGHPAYHAW